MNKRIKQLMGQTLDEKFSHTWSTLTPEDLERFVEHFAKLLIRDCANHCDLLLDHKISSEWSRGTHDCSRAIKKHFGVE